MISMIRFEHGEKTCRTEEGSICMWKGNRAFGTVDVCLVFKVELYKNSVAELVRCSGCINRFGTGDVDEDLRQEGQAEG